MVNRLIDIAVALVGLVVAAPFLLLAILGIWLEDRGPAIFRQVRVGKAGVPFSMLKLRSMRLVQAAGSQQITVGHDPRITRVGRWIRKTKLDEFPQLINVLRGEMAIVGPRPEVQKYVDLYSSDQREVLHCRPGVTDPASLCYYNESELLANAVDAERFYIDVILPDKIRINLRYAAERTLLTDLRVILATALRPLGLDLASPMWSAK